MKKDLITLKEIEEYLSGELNDIAGFEERLQEDDQAKAELKQIKKVIEGVKGYAFKQKLKEFHKTFFPPAV